MKKLLLLKSCHRFWCNSKSHKCTIYFPGKRITMSTSTYKYSLSLHSFQVNKFHLETFFKKLATFIFNNVITSNQITMSYWILLRALGSLKTMISAITFLSKTDCESASNVSWVSVYRVIREKEKIYRDVTFLILCENFRKRAHILSPAYIRVYCVLSESSSSFFISLRNAFPSDHIYTFFPLSSFTSWTGAALLFVVKLVCFGLRKLFLWHICYLLVRLSAIIFAVSGVKI